MSTDYGLHCKPCDSRSGAGTSWATKQLSGLARLSPDIKALAEKDISRALDIQPDFIWQPYDDEDRYLIDWLVKHAGHEMELYNLYGQYIPLEAVA